MQPSRNNTYSIPASPEVAAYEQQKLYEAALEVAISTPETIDASDIDRRRVEDMGASTVSAAEVADTATPETVFNPLDPAQILACGQGATALRAYAKEHLTRADLGLGA